MRIDPIHLQQQSKLISDYRNHEQKIMQYFDYLPFEKDTYQNRINDLNVREFDRKRLADTLTMINQQWDAPDSTHMNIERLNDKNSVVVIGGQQAGLLTGPMYTINKIISIIQLAKQQEKALQIPVIPVFWIAGEDHDFDEINHIFLPEVSKMKKYKLLQRVVEKKSVSHIPKEESYAYQWLNHVFEQLTETQHTKQVYESVKRCLDHAENYVDFFARIIYQLFKEEGIVLIDSSHSEIRNLESEHFVKMLEVQPKLSKGVYESEQQLKQSEYAVSLDVQRNDAHLFYHKDGERILLVRNSSGDWIGKQDEILLTTEEIIAIAKTQPELLSNNVVTRPLMQELLFPSLAFIGGPGEISYWSVLKPAFEAFNIKMPPVIPRLSFTFIERNVEKAVNKFDIKPEHAVNNGVLEERENWLASRNTPPIQEVSSQIKAIIEEAHKPLRDIATEMRSDLGDLADKNLHYLLCDIEYLEGRIIKAQEEKYAKELQEFDLVNTALYPNGGLQERVWNPLPWINSYGTQFIKRLTEVPCSFENEHYIVYI